MRSGTLKLNLPTDHRYIPHPRDVAQRRPMGGQPDASTSHERQQGEIPDSEVRGDGTVKRSEITALLTYLSEMDNRKWDEDTVSAWFETMGTSTFVTH